MIEAVYFYLFSITLLICAVATISAKNPVHAVLFLILGFLNAASLMIMMGAEFIGMMLIIVYVGAIAVLFLFIIMMLDIDITKLQPKKIPFKTKILSAALTLWMLMEFILVIKTSQLEEIETINDVSLLDNVHAIGQVLYTQYFYPFQISGIILLAAMVGAVTLAMRSNPNVRKQDVLKQINTDKNKVIEVRKVEIGKGAE